MPDAEVARLCWPLMFLTEEPQRIRRVQLLNRLWRAVGGTIVNDEYLKPVERTVLRSQRPNSRWRLARRL